MPFDPSTAKPEFDPTTAQPVEDEDTGMSVSKLLRSTMALTKLSGQVAAPTYSAVPAVGEAALSGMVSMGSQAAAGAGALFTTVVKSGGDKVAGKSFADTYSEDFNKQLGAIEGVTPNMPTTTSGQALTAALSHVLDTVVKGTGDAMYTAAEKFGASDTVKSVAGAAGQTAATAALLLAGGKKVAEKPKPTVMTGDIITDFARKYPNTARQLEASHVGDTPISAAREANPTKSLLDIAHEAVNKELGVTDAMVQMTPELVNVTLASKLEAVIKKYSTNIMEPISRTDQVLYAQAITDKIIEIQKYADSLKAAEKPAPLLLEKPQPVPTTIRVDSDGVAIIEPVDRVPLKGQDTPINAAIKLQDAKQQAKAVVNNELSSGRITSAYGFRGTDLNELRYIAKYGRLRLEHDFAGIPAATLESGEFAVAGTGVGIIVHPDHIRATGKKGESLINPKAAPQSMQFVIGGKAVSFDEMRAALKQIPIKKPDAGGKQKGIMDVEGLDANLPAGEAAAREAMRIAIRQNTEEANARIKAAYGKDYNELVHNRQAGILDIKGIEANIPSAKRAAEEAASRSWATANPDVAANKVKDIMQKNAEALEASQKSDTASKLKAARRMMYAHDYDIRTALKAAGPAGEVAHSRMVVQNGATMAAKVKMDKVNIEVFDKLSHSERKTLDEVTRLRRIVQIDKYKGIGTVRHEGGITGPMAAARLDQMRIEMGSNFDKINNSATSIFEQQKLLLDNLLQGGLIDKELHSKLYNLDYTRTEYLDLVDPAIPIASHVRNMPTSIRSSGIPEIGHGKTSFVNIDAQALLMEDMARVENRIFRNNTLKAARDLAILNPDNGIVSIPGPGAIKIDASGNQSMKHTPEGYTAIGVRVAGKQEFMLMKDEFAEQFIARPEAMPEWLAVTFRTMSGSSLIKLSSTGMNPSFVIAGIPMDIMHTWIASSNVYSAHLPKYLYQIGRDMTATAGDAFGKKGTWEDAMREGMGSSYLTHESRSLTDPSKSIHSQMAPHLARTKTALSYLNDVSDMWIRLAYRKRLIDSGMSSWEATAMARDRLDYFQGGMVTKAFDTIIPYTNVAIQATGKSIEAAARDPKAMAIKAAWITATAASIKLATMTTSPETDKNMSVMDKVRNFNITFGDQFYTFDQNGNKRYMYIPIRLDQTVMPFNAAIVGGLEKAEYGKVPSGLAGNAFGQISPVSSAFPIPSIDAIATYVSNYDQFTGSAVYKGPKVLSEDEVRTFGEGKATDPIMAALGQATGLSPMRLEAAAGKLINTNNFYIQAMGGAYKYMFNGANPRDQAASTMMMIQNVPGLNKIIKLTSSSADKFDELLRAEQEVGSKVAASMHPLNDLVFQYEHKQNNITLKTIETYINNQPPELRQKLADHAKYTIQVDKIMEHYKASDGIPQRAWWIASAKAPAEVRAQVFYNEWVSADSADRQRMLSIARSLQAAGVGYASEDFQKHFLAERKMLGDEQR